jgi:hypothetical protein
LSKNEKLIFGGGSDKIKAEGSEVYEKIVQLKLESSDEKNI